MLVRLGRYEEAIDAYRAALAVDPSKQPVRLNLGLALYKAARSTTPRRELAAVLAAQPDNLQARYLEADCQLRLGEPADGDRAARAARSARDRTTSRSPTCSGWPTCSTKQVEKGSC